MANGYMNQWINTVYKDMSSYMQFRDPSLNFYGDHKHKLDWRCSLYQSVYDRTKDGSMTAHFFCYSAVANNLTSKQTESDIVEIISGIFLRTCNARRRRGYGQFVML